MLANYRALKDFPIGRLNQCAEGWRSLADALGTQVADFDRTVVRPVDDPAWRGGGAEAARTAVHQAADRLSATQKYVDANAVLLQAAHHGIWQAGLPKPEIWATVHDDGRVSFDHEPDLFPWDSPPIVRMMNAQGTVYKLLHLADVVDRKTASLLWHPPTPSVDRIPAVADADEHLRQAKAAFQEVVAEVDGFQPVEEAHTDTPEQPRGDLVATKDDEGLRVVLADAAGILSLTGRPHGADHLRHWLRSSGTTKYVSPAEIRRDLPLFETIVRDALRSAPDEGYFDTGWQNTDVQDDGTGATQSQDWWYAMNDFRYRVLGRTTRAGERRRTYYTIGVLKPYVFGPPRGPIKVPYLDIEFDQAEIERLHHVGLARNFIIQGLSHGAE
ncbi:hypothetical protein [Amycolatopsis lexingtonensis]|uniref:hypothetical protein n=1 Tax=Amycolatopsis lexingtonensis TaxID=218822 RepID=UPI003F709A2C